MKTLSKIKNTLKRHENEIKSRYRIKKIGIFGSYANNRQKKNSDLDVLVDIEEPVSLLGLVGIENYISGLLGVKVDLVPREDIRSELKQSILKKVIYI
ncbi:MAG: nucleotidyltransferase family protein [Planctomycetes bacterium]|nr:nucleotidyltransferase family protein [Planctomycetota bacterium]